MIKFEFKKKLALLISIFLLTSSVYATKDTKNDNTVKSFSDRRNEVINKPFSESVLSVAAIITLGLATLGKHFSNGENTTNILKKTEPKKDENVLNDEDITKIVGIVAEYSPKDQKNYLVRKDRDGNVYKVNYNGKTYNVKALKTVKYKRNNLEYKCHLDELSRLNKLMVGLKHNNLVSIYGVHDSAVVMEHCENTITLEEFYKDDELSPADLRQFQRCFFNLLRFICQSQNFKDRIDEKSYLIYSNASILIDKSLLLRDDGCLDLLSLKNFKLCSISPIVLKDSTQISI
ncbi:MAG: hypothetical protein FWC41_08485 [Firmicutes bacterium]|nr:hypothetical protein [Bacillota bacterium]